MIPILHDSNGAGIPLPMLCFKEDCINFRYKRWLHKVKPTTLEISPTTVETVQRESVENSPINEATPQNGKTPEGK